MFYLFRFLVGCAQSNCDVVGHLRSCDGEDRCVLDRPLIENRKVRGAATNVDHRYA